MTENQIGQEFKMGKPTGFMEFPRRKTPWRDVNERLLDYYEIYTPAKNHDLKTQGARCMNCGVPFCESDHGCPIDNLIPEWNDLVYKEKWEEAYYRLSKTNNFPEFTGRACPAPCEGACVLGINEPAVTIKDIENSIIDRAFEEGWVKSRIPNSKTGKKIAIIGSGPAGYTAAIYAARANLKPHLISGLEPGGQLTITTDVENYPGYGDTIQGPWLMEEMKKQSLNVGTIIHNDLVTEVDFNSYPFISKTDSGLIFESKTVIISTGAQARWLGIKSEEKFKGYGISACATCDGFFFKDQEVAVIGGGNSAVEEALYLTNFASKVTLIPVSYTHLTLPTNREV